MSTGGQAAGNHYSIKSSADGSNILCSSANIREVYIEDLNLGEGCVRQQSAQHLGTAIGAITIKSLSESGLQSMRETAGLCVGVFGHPCMSMNKVPKGRMKNTSDNADALCICRNGFELLKMSSKLIEGLMNSHFNSSLRLWGSEHLQK